MVLLMKRLPDFVRTAFEKYLFDLFNLTKPSAHLTNISTGTIASPEIERSMTSLLEKGNEMIDKFVEESLIPHNGSTKKTSMQHIQGVRLRQMAIKIKVNKNHYKQT